MRGMNAVLLLVLGGAVALLQVAGAGVLVVRMSAAEAGAEVNLANEVVAITDPHAPVLPALLFAVLNCLAVVLLVAPARTTRLWRLAQLAYVATGTGLVIAAFTLSVYPPQGFVPGARGLIAAGGTSPALHLCIALVVMALLRSAIARSGRERQVATGDVAEHR